MSNLPRQLKQAIEDARRKKADFDALKRGYLEAKKAALEGLSNQITDEQTLDSYNSRNSSSSTLLGSIGLGGARSGNVEPEPVVKKDGEIAEAAQTALLAGLFGVAGRAAAFVDETLEGAAVADKKLEDEAKSEKKAVEAAKTALNDALLKLARVDHATAGRLQADLKGAALPAVDQKTNPDKLTQAKAKDADAFFKQYTDQLLEVIEAQERVAEAKTAHAQAQAQKKQLPTLTAAVDEARRAHEVAVETAQTRALSPINSKSAQDIQKLLVDLSAECQEILVGGEAGTAFMQKLANPNITFYKLMTVYYAKTNGDLAAEFETIVRKYQNGSAPEKEAERAEDFVKIADIVRKIYPDRTVPQDFLRQFVSIFSEVDRAEKTVRGAQETLLATQESINKAEAELLKAEEAKKTLEESKNPKAIPAILVGASKAVNALLAPAGNPNQLIEALIKDGGDFAAFFNTVSPGHSDDENAYKTLFTDAKTAYGGLTGEEKKDPEKLNPIVVALQNAMLSALLGEKSDFLKFFDVYPDPQKQYQKLFSDIVAAYNGLSETERKDPNKVKRKDESP